MPEAESRRRRATIVAIGASNLSRGLTSLTQAARARTEAPVELFVAAGHGRSYGANSRVCMRRLPSILWCGLWRALDRSTAEDGIMEGGRRPLAIVTDIGNDLLYGFSVQQVAAWVAECLRRLEDRGFRTTVTRLPMASIATVGTVRYRALRTVYVPGCRLSLDELKANAAELDALVASLAVERGATVIDQPGAWYGIDAIHVRRRNLRDLWRRVGDAWGLPAVAGIRTSAVDWARVGLGAAEVRSIANIPRFTPQPAVTLRDHSRVWLY